MGKTKGYIIEDPERLNRLAREQLKEKLLTDIVIDMEICKIEGWDIMEYLLELQQLINDIVNKNKTIIKK